MKVYWAIIIFMVAAMTLSVLFGCGDNNTLVAEQRQDQKQAGTSTGISLIWHDDEGWQNNTFYTSKAWYSGDTLYIKYEPQNITILNTGGEFYITYFEILY